MIKSRLLIFAFFLLICTSCSTVLENEIDQSSLEENIQYIKKNYPELDTLKLLMLDNLLIFNRGREAYISFIESKSENSNSFSRMIIKEEKFKEQQDNLFNYFKAKRVSFEQLLAERFFLK